jgi:hypothetical protein
MCFRCERLLTAPEQVSQYRARAKSLGVSPRAPPDPLPAGLTVNEGLVHTMIVPAMPKMKKQTRRYTQAYLIRSTFYLLMLVATCSIPFVLAERNAMKPEAPTKFSQRTLTFAERVAYQRVIEEVYWRHRIWPKERHNLKPAFDAVMSQAQLEKKVADYLRESQTLEDYWHRPITRRQLQAEMDRMAQHTKRPQVLREIFQALGDDPLVIAECLARPILAQRLLTEVNEQDHAKLTKVTWLKEPMAEQTANYSLPAISTPSVGLQ